MKARYTKTITIKYPMTPEEKRQIKLDQEIDKGLKGGQ